MNLRNLNLEFKVNTKNANEYLRENHENLQLPLDPVPSNLSHQGKKGSSHSSSELSSSDAIWLVRK